MSTRPQIFSGILLFLSALGVTFSGPVILGWIPRLVGPFWNFGSPWIEIGGFLDIIGGLLQFFWLFNMYRLGYFKGNADQQSVQNAYKIMAGLSVIGIIADPLGGLLAIAAQIELYTSLINIYLLRKTLNESST